MTNWIRAYDNGIEWLDHIDGIDWFSAPMPPLTHVCTPQTRGWIDGHYIERCSCAAIRVDRFQWLEKNVKQNCPPRLGFSGWWNALRRVLRDLRSK